ncbi:ribosomal protein S5 domain 2-type protein [Dunaliella salina]|uniref:Ribosomal RNA-processing protein 42 n=1 Tax=Dunaliella salina TaxID=3046 RepID=A0ABQ7GYW6_DUNSA|nr:ribosomal protein S5 domain 2-type protein [Dunaliella salina]|eukprot:KAF5839749.1 ribosomal protein S5 domain 2-type protein [Dunaliella salina]
MSHSSAEIDFCTQSCQHGIRLDGRACEDFRPLELELGLIAQASGSARLHLGSTDVIVGVKAEVGAPLREHPDCGRLQATVEMSSCASPEYEGRGGELWGLQLAQALEASLVPEHPEKGGGGLDLRSLSIIPGKAVWLLYVDALVLNDGGGVLCVCVCVALAALSNTRVCVCVFTMGGGAGEGDAAEPEIELEDDEEGEGGRPLQGVAEVPLIVSLGQVDNAVVVDPTCLEEQCAASVMHIAANARGEVCGVQQSGRQGVDPAALVALMERGAAAGSEVLASLHAYFKQAPQQGT